MPPAQAADDDRVPGLRAVSASDVGSNVGFGLRMRGVARGASATHARARRWRWSGLPRRSDKKPHRALRRPAAARGAGARAGGRAGGAAARRAARRARPEAPAADAGRAEGDPEARRHRLRPCHARPGGGDGARRPLRGHERRAASRTRARPSASTRGRRRASAPPSWARARCSPGKVARRRRRRQPRRDRHRHARAAGHAAAGAGVTLAIRPEHVSLQRCRARSRSARRRCATWSSRAASSACCAVSGTAPALTFIARRRRRARPSQRATRSSCSAAPADVIVLER